MEHFGSPDGYAGVPILDYLVHDPHCCAARGCHQVCSHLCGTDLYTGACCGITTPKEHARCQQSHRDPDSDYPGCWCEGACACHDELTSQTEKR